MTTPDDSGQWCASPVLCSNCGCWWVGVIPARTALEGMPLECGECGQYEGALVDEETIWRIKGNELD